MTSITPLRDLVQQIGDHCEFLFHWFFILYLQALNLDSASDDASAKSPEPSIATSKPVGATLFDDETSNVTWTYDTSRRIGTKIGPSHYAGTYFEGNNFYVYIHGSEDPEGEWWKTDSDYKKAHSKGGVLVNCHFDS
jgi:hypothetical protein